MLLTWLKRFFSRRPKCAHVNAVQLYKARLRRFRVMKCNDCGAEFTEDYDY